MTSYIIQGLGVKKKLDTHEEVMDLLIKMKDKYPDFDYNLSIDVPTKDWEWTIKLQINNEKLKETVLRNDISTHGIS